MSKIRRNLRKKRRKAEKGLSKSPRGKNITKFHIIAKSIGGTYADDNISYVERDKHRGYHFLFSLMKPNEVINELIDNYWNGQEKWIFKALKERRTKHETV